MTLDQWTEVDRYFTESLAGPTPVLRGALDAALAASHAAGLPPIQVSAPQGKLLHLFARITGARKILEIGALGGYSAIWLASALAAGGRFVTLEIDPKHAEVARQSLARAKLDAVAEVRVGRALDLLPQMRSEGPFDLIFIDADKPSNPDYFRWAVELGRSRTVIVVDNVVRKGAVADAASTDANVRGVREMIDLVSRDARVSATAIQTVGSKGYDGFLLARVE